MAGQVLGKVTAGGGTHLISNTFYGTCTSSSFSATKKVYLNDANINSLSLIPGMLLTVKFSYINSASNPTLVIYNQSDSILVNSIPIKKYGTTFAESGLNNSWTTGAVVAFVYDGTNWVEVSFWETPQELGFAYLECTTPEATLTKETSTLTDDINNGTIVAVKFTNNVFANSTLYTAESSDDYYPIYYKGSPIVDNIILAGDTATFIFDESGYYHLISVDQSCRVIKDNNIEVGTVPSSNQYAPVIEWVDANNEQMGYIHSQYLSGDRVRMAIGVHRDVNGSDVYRAVTASIDADGNGLMEFDGDIEVTSTTPQFITKRTNVALDTTGTNSITENALVGEFLNKGSDDSLIGSVSTQMITNGTVRTRLLARNMKTDGTYVTNELGPIVKKDGTQSYLVTEPDEFCKVLHVGDRVAKDQSTAVSITDSAWKNICSISLPAGTWIIEATAQFASNATGRRYAAISETANAASAAVQRETCNSIPAVSGGTTYIHTGCTKVLTATTTIYLIGWQGSGTALNTYGYISAVRIR